MNKKWQYLYFKRARKIGRQYLYVQMDTDSKKEEDVLLTNKLNKLSVKTTAEFATLETRMSGMVIDPRGTDKKTYKVDRLSTFVSKEGTDRKVRDAHWDMGTSYHFFDSRRKCGKKKI